MGRARLRRHNEIVEHAAEIKQSAGKGYRCARTALPCTLPVLGKSPALFFLIRAGVAQAERPPAVVHAHRDLRQATSFNAELLALSGPHNPYPGRLGVVAEGALADLLLVDGDSITDIRLFEDPARTLLVIMKGGKLCKHTAAR